MKNKQQRDENGRFIPKVSRKIFSSDVYNIVVEDLANEKEICDKCLTHEQERVKYFCDSIATLNDALIKSRKEIEELKHYGNRHADEYFCLTKQHEDVCHEAAGLKRQLEETIHKLLTTQQDVRMYSNMYNNCNDLKQEAYRDIAKLKKDIVMRAWLWCTVGLLGGIVIEMFLKLLR